MNKIQSIILIPFVIMGCQSSTPRHTAITGTQTAIEQPSTPAPKTTEASIPSDLNIKQPPLPSTTEDVHPTEDLNKQKSKEAAAQEEIDQALELCDSAQTLWEKGELENALTELDMAYAAILDLDIDTHPQLNQQKEDIRYMISKRILEIYASRNIVINGNHDAIPLTMNSYVKKELNRFTGQEKRFFIQSMERAGRYQPYIAAELKKAGLPEELSWLPLIESGFKIRALSPARALGLWQFIPSTGYKFGLKRDYYVDERLDPIKSTQAAIAYLKELHSMFGDWATVLAAYNCGEGRVLRTIRKQNINYLDNFWDLYEKLPRETARYVPRFLATLHIVKNLEQYNFKPVKAFEPYEYKTCTIKKQIRLRDIAKEIGVKTTLLKDLNPELRYALLPPEEYKLRIPATKVDTFLARLDKIKSSYTAPTRYSYHKIRRGDTLSGIAKRYHTSLRRITSANNISKRSILRVGKVLKVPGANTRIPVSVAGAAARTPGKAVKYTVKQGDNLWLIAGRYRTTTKKIMAANRLKSSALHIGQKLKIPTGRVKSKTFSTHFVKSGDNPFTIAKKYNMTLHRLLTLNHLTSRSKIYPGQKLLVE
ncbi:MAG: LysM peptidoglycan-binding domain-containing protein [Desulfobacteraceae bacterium]|nr:LysM peptidoglycan-binding domain-containing protein [Desulfobacteraceae bacterium]